MESKKLKIDSRSEKAISWRFPQNNCRICRVVMARDNYKIPFGQESSIFCPNGIIFSYFDRESASLGKNITVFCPNDGQRISPVSISKHMTEEGWPYITRQRRILASLMCQTLYSSSASLTFSCLVRVYTEIFPKCSHTMASTFVHNSISDI